MLQDKHEPLISSELFNQVAAVRERRGLGITRTKYDAESLKSRYMVQNLTKDRTGKAFPKIRNPKLPVRRERMVRSTSLPGIITELMKWGIFWPLS